MLRYRYVGWLEYGELAEALASKVTMGGERFDLVVGIARGGIPIAMVVSDRIGARIDLINVKSYSGIAQRAAPRILTTLTEKIAGRAVLLVDDLVDQGDTMVFLKSYLAKQKPKVLRTAVLFKKPWSKTEPDYFLEELKEWVVFPFEVGEVERLRAQPKESLGKRKK